MEYNRILSRACQIVWRNKSLWLLGFLAELPVIADVLYDTSRRVFGLRGILCCIPLLVRIGLLALPIIVVAALIRGVNQIERKGQAGLRESWEVGVSKFWTILGISVLLTIPILLLGLGGLAVIEIPPVLEDIGSKPFSWVYLILSLIVILILSYIWALADRAVVLEGCGSIRAIKRGWWVLGANVLHIVGLSFILFLISLAILVIILIPLVALSVPADNLAELVRRPEVVLVSLYPGGVTLLAILWVPVAAVLAPFKSAVWTLAYRELQVKMRRRK